MNRIYRLVWNHALGALVPVSEIARAKGGAVTRRNDAVSLRLSPLGGALALALSLSPTVALAQRPMAVIEAREALPLRVASQASIVQTTATTTTAAMASQLAVPSDVVAPSSRPLPTGGQVVSGQVGFTQDGHTLTIDQSSQKAIIDWQSFDIGSGNTVTFHQPGRDSVALNRVLGSDPSAIYGHLNANGQVFLVNPYGVYFAPGAQVDVGGLVASTLNLSDDDFLNSRYHFSGSSSAGVRNDGSIQSAQGGYVAFIGRRTNNTGSLSTPSGTTALGAGGSVSLTMAGQELVSFQVDGAALDALAANGGVIDADGGKVILSAQAKDALLQTVVNNQGRIQAQTVQSHGGTIDLLGGDAGTVQVAGTLDASAPTGDGGAIETSGAHVTVADGAVITTAAAQGSVGSWLIDPQNYTIAASGGDISGATLSANLGNNNVTIQSSSGGTSGAGDILVNDSVSWSAHTLTLHADHNIVINAAMNASNAAGLKLQYGQATTDGKVGGVAADYSVNAPINLASTSSFITQLGSAGPTINYTILTSLGAAGSTSGADLQGISGNLAGDYVLGSDIDASTTATWNSGAGFNPLGSTSTAFSGIFDGLGHTITGLTIVRPSTSAVGLFGTAGSNGTAIRNIGLINSSVSGNKNVGSLAGSNYGIISHAYTTGNVTGASSNTGGLVGWNRATITDAHAAGSVTGAGKYTGGLVGQNLNGAITDVYVTGSVTGNFAVGGLVGVSVDGSVGNAYASGSVSGNLSVGGLIGSNIRTAVSNVYASNSVTATGSNVGGLVGVQTGGSINNAYASGRVSGQQQVGGLVGQSNGDISNVYATGSVSATVDNAGGLIGDHIGGTIASAYALGDVTGTAANKGYLVGLNEGGSITNGYWDTVIGGRGFAGIASSENDPVVTGGGGLTTAMLAAKLPTGFDGSTWGNGEGQTTPYLLSHASFDTIGGSARLGSDTNIAPTAYSVILSVQQLQNISRTGLAGKYVQGMDIDASATAGWNAGAGFVPIGNGSTNFTGVFDGLGYVITGLTINRPTTDAVGLFGVVGTQGTVRNLGLLGGSIHGRDQVGEIAGVELVGGSIDTVYATGSVSGRNLVGGLIGLNGNGGHVANAYATGSVTGSSKVGGLIGSNQGILQNAYATGSVSATGGFYAGGLVGFNRGAISNVYASGSVIGKNEVGGLVGSNYTPGNDGGGSVTNAYATGSVTGVDGVGGLAGVNGGVDSVTGGDLNNVYATGHVTGTGIAVGGLIGINSFEARASNAYWDIDTTGQSKGIGSGFSQVVVGMTTAQLAAALPQGFDAGVWGNGDNQTTPYLLANAGFDTVGGSVLLGSDASATPTAFNVILNVNQLQSIARVGLAANYVLGGDIDASNTANWNGGAGFDPIDGVGGVHFTGIFDGLGHVVTGLSIQRSTSDNVGFFGAVGSNGIVRNVGLVGGTFKGQSGVGSLVGSNSGTLRNVYSTSAVRGSVFNTGGLAGLNFGTITNAYATGSVTGGGGSNAGVGGLVGLNVGVITNAYATGSVRGGGGLGGLVGTNGFSNSDGGSISNAYATGSVEGDRNVGGLVGRNTNAGSISNAYATGIVKGSVRVGGLVGINSQGSIADVYATGRVTGYSSIGIGGLVGSNSDATITHGYWDTEATGQSTGVGSGTNASTDVHGLTTSQMQQQSSFVGFDFDTPTWVIYDGHTAPLLRAFLTALTVTADDQSHEYAGQTAQFSLSNAHFSIDGADTSGHLFGLGDSYGGDVNAGTYLPDLWSDQQGFFVTYAGGSLTITPKALTLTGLKVADKVYDGTTAATIDNSQVTLGGIIGNDDVSLSSGAGGVSFSDANVGTNKTVDLSGLSLSGAAAGNYTLANTASTTTANIKARQVSLLALAVNSKTYDGTTGTSLDASQVVFGGLAGNTDSGLVGDDQIQLSASSVNFRTAGAGTNKTVDLSGLGLSGTAAGNYVLVDTTGAAITMATATADIAQRELTITGLTVDDKEYDGTRNATLGSTTSLGFTGLIAGDSVQLNNAGVQVAFADANAGVGKAVTVTGLSLSGTSAANYTINGANPTTATITPKALTISGLTVNDKEYDGTTTAQLGSTTSLGFTGLIDGDNVQLDDTGVQALFADANAGVGKAVTVTGLGLSGTSAGNYTIGGVNPTTGTITPKALTITGLTVDDKEYDGTTTAQLGSTASLGFTGLIDGDNVQLDDTGVQAAFANANAGVGKAVSVTGLSLSGTSAGNYTISGANATTATITPKALTITGLTVNDKEYDGTTTAQLGSTTNLGFTGLIVGDSVQLDDTGVQAAFADANAGVGKTVNVTGLSLGGGSADNYTISGVNPTTATITPKALTITGLTVDDKEYDGTTTAQLGSTAGLGFTGLISGDSVQLDDAGVQVAFTDANAGVGKAVTVTGLSLSGISASNYTISGANPTAATITPKQLTLSGLTVNGKVYDGTMATNIATVGNFGDGVIGSDDVRLDIDGASAAFADANVGTGKTVKVTNLGLTGNSAGNYVLASTATTTADITARELTFTSLMVNNKTYDGSTTAAVGSLGTLSGLVGNDQVQLGVGSATFADANVGTNKTVNISGLSLSGAAAGNYVLASASTTATANIAARQVSLSGLGVVNKTYDGNTDASLDASQVVFGGITGNVDSGLVGDDQIQLSADSATFLDANAGRGKTVTISGLGLLGAAAGNYVLTDATGKAITASTATADIAAKQLSLTNLKVADKVYDGTTAATIDDAQVTLSGIVGTDDVSLSGSVGSVAFSDANAGTNKTVNISSLSLSGTAANNYVLADTAATTTASITPKTLTFTGLTVADKVYDGTTNGTFSDWGTLSGVVGDDKVHLGVAVVNFADANVGTNKAVSISELGLFGAAAGNYVLESTTATGTANITARPVSLSGLGVVNKTYDGNTVASLDASQVVFGGITGNAKSGLVDGDQVQLGTGSATFADANAGTGKTVTISGLSLLGAAASNYVLEDGTGAALTTTTVTADIAAKQLSLTGLKVADKVYDGTTAATIDDDQVTLEGIVGTDDVSLSGSVGSIAFSDANAGTNKTVSISGLGLSGTAANNYVLADTAATTTASITPKTLTFTGLTVADKVYDGTTNGTFSDWGTLSGVVGDDKVHLGVAVVNFADANVGTNKAVSISELGLFGAAAGNYVLESTTATGTANITARPVSLSGLGVVNKTYDGNTVASLDASQVVFGGITGNAKSGLVDGDQIQLGAGSATFADANAGTGKQVTISGLGLLGADAGNYVLEDGTGAALTTTTATANIAAKQLSLTGLKVADKVYDGTTAATIDDDQVTLEGIVGTDDVSLSGSVGSVAFSDANAGTNKTVSISGLSLSGTAANNYVLADTAATTTASIVAKTLTFTGLGVDDKVYDGSTTATLGNLGTLGGIVGDDDVSLSDAGATMVFANADVGTNKTVTISGLGLSGAAADNYVLANTSTSATASITPKSLTLAGLTVNNKTYDGNTGATIGSLGTLSGLVDGDQVQLGTGSATFADANAGTGKQVTISGLGLLGADAGNYVLEDGTGAALTTTTATAAIAAKSLSLTGLKVADKVYDGTTAATIDDDQVTLDGIVGTDDVSLSGSVGSVAFSDANAGTNKTVNISGLSLGGTAANNYVLADTAATTTASITPKSLTLAGLTVNNKTYDGTTGATIGSLGTLSGLIDGDQVQLGTGSATFADANAGTDKTVNIGGLGLLGAAAGNYVLEDDTGTVITTTTARADITPKTLTFADLGINDKVYDGSTAATIGSLGTLSGIVGNDQVSLSGAGASAAFTDANAGTGKTIHVTGLGLSGAASGNYVLSSTQADATADIARRVLTVAGLAVNNKEYDGTTAATVSNLDGLRLAGVVSGDDVGLDDEGLHVAFADANAGTNKAVTVSGLVLSGNSAGNYELGASPTTASILRRVLTVSGVTVNGKVYDGSTAATLAGAGGFGDRVVSGDDVQLDLESALAAFVDANAGNGKTVHVSGLGLSGADADNYALASSAVDATADIARRALTVSVVGNPTKTFDGSTDVSLDASNFRLDGFVAGESARVTPTTGRYASADVGTGIEVSASLDAGDFAANAGTLLGNYLLPEVAMGQGSIIGVPSGPPKGIDPALLGAVASATRSTPWGYTGLDYFALPLDPRRQIRVQTHGQFRPARLAIHGAGRPPQSLHCATDGVEIDPFVAPSGNGCRRN